MKKPTCITLIYILVFTMFGCALNVKENSQKKIDPVAHKGCNKIYFGNSKNAVECAIKEGILVEVDIRESKDHELFLFHDKRFSTEQPVSLFKEIENKKFEDIQSEIIKKIKFKEENLDKIISFQEALDILVENKNTNAMLLLDMKNQKRIIKQVFEQVVNNHLLEKVVFTCYTHSCVDFLRKMSNGYLVKILFIIKNIKQLEEVLKLKTYLVQIDKTLLNEELVKKIKENGSMLLVKSIDSNDNPAEWLELYEKGVDLILTDEPQRFIKWKSE